jgi:hypothetical protein
MHCDSQAVFVPPSISQNAAHVMSATQSVFVPHASFCVQQDWAMHASQTGGSSA